MAKDAVMAIPDIHLVTFGITVFGLLFLYLGKRFLNPYFQARYKLPLPLELFLVIICIISSILLKLHDDYGVKIVKNVPQGLPTPSLPKISILSVIWKDGINLAGLF
jgi:MFS superfamily sulfate permease-like transporter